ncbi:gamma-glutamylcyclotransferase [Oceaniglobus ichthyenteri]|uniref:gamma-glutamylcyclotransferase n=1 Tax=Oceaniglobus ichthyenteri TaxID=2136177 RepID=UPI000D36EB0B|nr:gamma-glutamylcyclotransferase [Oceaniglobus ichthyenteri]
MAMWVFGYGSLMWNPGFPVAEQGIATLADHMRTFCMRSIHHRGTDENPGLVLALDPAPRAACVGLGFRVAPNAEERTLDELRERELISSAYVERILPMTLADGRVEQAVTYVVDTEHVQYCGGLTLEDQAQIIARAVGQRGPNTEYLFNTAAHLAEMGIPDGDLAWLDRRVRDILMLS